MRVRTPKLPSVTLEVLSLFFKRDMAAETSLEKTATHLVVFDRSTFNHVGEVLLNNSEISSCWEHKSDVLMYGGACGGGATLPSTIRSCRRFHTSNIRLMKDSPQCLAGLSELVEPFFFKFRKSVRLSSSPPSLSYSHTHTHTHSLRLHNFFVT